MSVQRDSYEELLATFSHHSRAVALLRHHRPYFEKIPSIRRSSESIITLPLPIVKVRQRATQFAKSTHDIPYELIHIPCDLAVLMCDPDWRIKAGIEVFIFIHRFGEEFSDLMRRWRDTQVAISRGYSWEMPPRHQHILCEGNERQYPLFVLTPETHPRVAKGLKGAYLPYTLLDWETMVSNEEDENAEATTSSPVGEPNADAD